MSKATILDFWSPTCGPCKALEPAIEAFITNNEHRVQGQSIDTSNRANAALVQKYNVRTVPTLIVVKDGKELGRVTGIAPVVSAIDAWVTGLIGR